VYLKGLGELPQNQRALLGCPSLIPVQAAQFWGIDQGWRPEAEGLWIFASH
jgi:hypothetical protein